MSEMRERLEELKFLGGALCLDFANTVDWRTGEHREDLVHDYEDLLAWARRVGAFNKNQADRLRRRANARPNQARAAFSRAVSLREAIYRIFSAHARGAPGTEEDLEVLNTASRETAQHLRLRHSAEGYAWEWHDVADRLDWLSWMIARSAADLLTSPRGSRVCECAGPGCGWLFVDTSRNQSRRWCDMASCGNRAKARRNYTRKRQAERRSG